MSTTTSVADTATTTAASSTATTAASTTTISPVIAAVKSAKNEEEVVTLMSIGLPRGLVDFYQEKRRAAGYSAAEGGTVYVIGLGFYVVFIVIIQIITGILFTIIMKPLKSPIGRIIVGLLVCTIGAYLIYYFMYRPSKSGDFLANAQADFGTIFKKEGFQDAVPEAALEQPLVNLQPLSAKQAAYIGPKEDGGFFDPETGIQTALKAGVRFYILQIDTLTVKKDSKAFDAPGVPTLLYRNDKQALISANGANLGTVATNFANYAFSEAVLNSNLPLVLYLHFVNTPSPIKAPEEYLKFLSKTAAALEPLFPNVLGSTAEGNFGGQRSEAVLIKTPVKSFEKKVIYMTNVDTSLFRKPELFGMKPFETKYDLDALVALRVYADTDADAIGATTIATGDKKPAAVLVTYKRLQAMSEKDRDTFAQKGKDRFVIAMPAQVGNPSKKDIDIALNRFGVNVLPLNLFGESVEDLQKKMGFWAKGRFLHVKPPALQTLSTAVVPNN